MAGAQPKVEDIQTVIAITGTATDSQAAHLMSQHNKNLEAALNAFFEQGVSAFNTEQPNNTWQPMDNNPPSFRIDTDDTANSSVRAAASRPNSRTSYRGEITDLTAEHAAADNPQTKSNRERQEEEDLQKALALSRGEEYIPPQENGVTGTGQQFSAATNAFYDTSKWAMTTTNASFREVIDHPPPSKRRRVSDHPAFLRGSSETGYLAALLTIYHSIPLARESLLLPPMKVHSYGYDPTWWSGTSDENSKSVSVDSLTVMEHDSNNLLCEVQQIMGVLDGTNRAYGSVDALANLRKYQTSPADSHFSRFLEIWRMAAMQHFPDEQLTQIFTSIALKDAEYTSVNPISKVFHCLETPVQGSGKSLYEILDGAIWTDEIDLNMDDVWIDTLAEVFTMRLFDPEKSGEGLGIKPPAIWWPDRYLHECQEQSWEMRGNMQKCRREVARLTAMQKKCQHVDMHDGRKLDVRATLQSAAEAAGRTVSKVKSKQLPNGTIPDELLETQLNSSHYPSVSKAEVNEIETDLEQIIARIDRKLALLEERKEEMKETQRKFGQALTQANNNPFEPPHRKYTLQGVATKPGVMFVRKPIVEDLVNLEMADNQDEEKPKIEGRQEESFQWWHISCSKDDVQNQKSEIFPGSLVGPITEAEAQASQLSSINDHGDATTKNPDWQRKVVHATPETPGYSIRKVKEYEVLKAARDDSDSVVLVYANENAMKRPTIPIPESLKSWVDTDNAAFERELQAEQDQVQIANDEEARRADGFQRWGDMNPNHNSSSDEVLEGVFEDVPLSATGLDLNSSSPSSRDADGQPSPKRAKSSDAEEPPPYEAAGYQEMQEKPRTPFVGGSRVGKHADSMMERIEASEKATGSLTGSQESGAVHIEHDHEPLR